MFIELFDVHIFMQLLLSAFLTLYNKLLEDILLECSYIHGESFGSFHLLLTFRNFILQVGRLTTFMNQAKYFFFCPIVRLYILFGLL